ncbi:hypothetical protein T492DRAFT_909803, partial [Pavlovales sp. CCMP2436]
DLPCASAPTRRCAGAGHQRVGHPSCLHRAVDRPAPLNPRARAQRVEDPDRDGLLRQGTYKVPLGSHAESNRRQDALPRPNARQVHHSLSDAVGPLELQRARHAARGAPQLRCASARAPQGPRGAVRQALLPPERDGAAHGRRRAHGASRAEALGEIRARARQGACGAGQVRRECIVRGLLARHLAAAQGDGTQSRECKARGGRARQPQRPARGERAPPSTDGLSERFAPIV